VALQPPDLRSVACFDRCPAAAADDAARPGRVHAAHGARLVRAGLVALQQLVSGGVEDLSVAAGPGGSPTLSCREPE
jgi:hypothetical protein